MMTEPSRKIFSDEERLEMLDDFLNSMTPDELFEELNQYEAVGPKAVDFLSDIRGGNESGEVIGGKDDAL